VEKKCRSVGRGNWYKQTKKIEQRPNCKDTFSIVKGLTNLYIKTVSFCYLSIRISHVNFSLILNFAVRPTKRYFTYGRVVKGQTLELETNKIGKVCIT
jgi:hypothetical protein